jgi:hypothetical protein
MTASDAITALTAAFDDACFEPGAAGAAGTAVISWPAVPIEVVRATGLAPVVVRGGVTPTPAADVHLENGVFPSRIRRLVQSVVTERHPLACVVLPRTSDADYKSYLYLRELVRRRDVRHSGPLLLFDLLQSAGSEVAAHNAARVRDLFAALGAAGAPAPIDRLVDAIAQANAARAAVRRLVALRSGPPRIRGADVLPLIGAFWQLPPEVYTPLAAAAADSIARRPPLEEPQVLFLGAPVDGPALHAAVEAHGAVVVSEPGPWGVGAAGDDVNPAADPFVAIAEKYRRDAWGPRTSLADCRQRITHALTDVDAVVVSLPPDDAVFGWDYPWLRAQLQARQVPHVCLTHDPCRPMPAADADRVAALVSGVARRRAATCGEGRCG